MALEEARRDVTISSAWSLASVLAHQHLHQLEPEIRHAVLGNAGALLSFRVGAEDAAVPVREFFPTFASRIS